MNDHTNRGMWQTVLAGTLLATLAGCQAVTVYPTDLIRGTSLEAKPDGQRYKERAEQNARILRSSYQHEWRLNRHDKSAPPRLGLALSGGGTRSAAFCMGVMHALHDNDLLSEVDVMSGVSGGSYTLSWYFLQHHNELQNGVSNAGTSSARLADELFYRDGRYQHHNRAQRTPPETRAPPRLSGLLRRTRRPVSYSRWLSCQPTGSSMACSDRASISTPCGTLTNGEYDAPSTCTRCRMAATRNYSLSLS